MKIEQRRVYHTDQRKESEGRNYVIIILKIENKIYHMAHFKLLHTPLLTKSKCANWPCWFIPTIEIHKVLAQEMCKMNLR